MPVPEMTMKQACEYLGVERPTLLLWVRKGLVPGYRLGGRWRFYSEDLDKAVKKGNPENEERRKDDDAG